MSKRAEQEITEMAHSATAGWCCTNPQRMAAAIRGYKLGYKQAEQDLALTWEDLRTINDLFLKVDAENSEAWDYEVIKQDLPFPYGQHFYEEVLRRFREMKNK